MAVASLAAASLITLGSASASAKDHADWALEFLDKTIADNNTWGNDPACYINWETAPAPAEDGSFVPGEGMPAWSAMTKGACFFTLTLQKSMGYTQDDIKRLWRKNSPTSDQYFDVINASPAVGAAPPGIETYFRRVTRAIDVQKGDVLVVGATATYAGHTVVITGTPTEILPQINPRYSGTKQYAVPIADSTETAHGCNESYPDSRWSGPCTGGYMTSGAGTGYMRVYTDSLTGILLGYTWSVTSSTTSYYSPSTRPFRIGRLFKLPAPLPTDPPPPPP
ncbi:hypothetical protein [Sorangium sp. So ce388]|uniref:hypothetical protein n=1 Tax=Sorangium sp. So ce388 TaxID=3133309 RepID=UPI003F5C03DB